MKKLLIAAALSFVATPVFACPKSDHADAPPATTKTADKDKAPAPKTTPAKKQAPAKKKTDTKTGTSISLK